MEISGTTFGKKKKEKKRELIDIDIDSTEGSCCVNSRFAPTGGAKYEVRTQNLLRNH